MGERVNPGRASLLSTQHSRAVADVIVELGKAAATFKPFNSPHEGWAVAKEELDELWEHVRANTGRGQKARTEAIHLAAMALRYAADLTDELTEAHRCPQFSEHVEHVWGEWWCPGVKFAEVAR